MIGGEDEVVTHLDPIFRTIAPGVDTAPRTPGLLRHPVAPPRTATCTAGPNGAGHFVKMVHNGIEYGMMAAYAEGLNVLKHANAGKVQRTEDAETAPLRDPQYYQYDLDIPAVAEVWRRGQRRRVVAPRPHRARAQRSRTTSPTSKAASPTPARVGGRCSPRSTRASPSPVLVDRAVPTLRLPGPGRLRRTSS